MNAIGIINVGLHVPQLHKQMPMISDTERSINQGSKGARFAISCAAM